MDRVLVTGATGFLGRHLLLALKDGPFRPVALVRSASSFAAEKWRPEAGELDVIEGDPVEVGFWEKRARLDGIRTIFHLAAQVKHSRDAVEEMHRVNVEGTLNMVRLAAKTGARLVFVSSSGTVGCYRHADLRADEQAPFAEAVSGKWPYYASKIRAEKEARALAQKLGVELVIVRPPVLLGPGDHRFRSTGHVTKLMEGKVPFLGQGGMHFTDIRDVASAMARIPSLAKVRDTYHFPGTECSLAGFFGMVAEVSGAELPKLHLPAWLAKGVARTGSRASSLAGRHPPKWLPDPVVVEMSTHYWGLSTLWTHEELGYVPRAPRQTLVDTVHWLRQHHPTLSRARAA